MADEDQSNEHSSTPIDHENALEAKVQEPTPSSAPVIPEKDRSTLLDRARVFLRSPTVVHEDSITKRRFLTEKGLQETEIDGLMNELPPQLPTIPPRTYPQPPPSNLPRLLLGLTKIFTWLTGSSAILIFIYYRFLLPRITHSALARRSLKQHQVSLLKRLNASLADLKTSQAEARAVLPKLPTYEPVELAKIHSLEKFRIELGQIYVPEYTLLRCAIEGLAAEGKKVTKEELFALLEKTYKWLKTDEGLAYQKRLWETLTSNPCFSEHKEDDRLVWTYTPPPPETTPFLSSLEALKISMPPPRTQPSPIQRTLDVLADFTGYITTQTYQFAAGTIRALSHSHFGPAVHLTPQQEEVKKEIRALKGLVLNRRTFAPTAVRPASYTSVVPTP